MIYRAKIVSEETVIFTGLPGWSAEQLHDAAHEMATAMMRQRPGGSVHHVEVIAEDGDG